MCGSGRGSQPSPETFRVQGELGVLGREGARLLRGAQQPPPPRRWAHTPGRGRRVCTAFLQGVGCTPHRLTIGPPQSYLLRRCACWGPRGCFSTHGDTQCPTRARPPSWGGLLQQVRDRDGSGARRALQPERPTSQPDPHPPPDWTPRPRPSFQASTWAPVWAQRPCGCSRKLISPSLQPDGRTGTCYHQSH